MSLERAAIRQATERANRERGKSFTVSVGYRDNALTYYVTGPENPPIQGTETICIAQFWSEQVTPGGSIIATVQVRYAGGRSEWVYF